MEFCGGLKHDLFLLFFLIGIVSCHHQPNEPKLFTLLSQEETDITFRNDLTSTAEVNILEYLYFYNGGGVAAGDINNDGLVDIYFTSNQGENKLYLNKGNFQFEDITQKAGVTGEGGWSTGVTMTDVNGDGLLDIYLCQVGDYKGLQGKNKLYINKGDLSFIESAAEYGIDFVGFSTHALFFDYDRDGDLDLYLLNHSIKKPEVFSHADTRFENQDEKGGDILFKSLVSEGENRMVNVTEEVGILSSSLGFGLGVGIADLDGDSWLDLYVSNDFTEDDYLYINQQDGTFKESLQEYISNTSRYSMGNDLADINNDGLPDIFTTDMLPSDPEIWMKSVGEDKYEVYQIKKNLDYGDQYVRNHLQLNQKNGRFAEIGLLTNTFATDWSWSPLIFDMDNDGLKDIHVTNGIVKRPNDLDFIQYSQQPTPGITAKELQEKQIEMLPTVKLPNATFKNEGNLKFADYSKKWGLDQLSYSNGSAYADLDNDGDLDLIINNTNQEAFIYSNNSTEILNHQFIQIDLREDSHNPFAIGAQIFLFQNGESFHQTLSTSRGFQSGGSTTLTFGLGKNPKLDSLIVVWPDGIYESFQNPAVDKRQVIEKGKGNFMNTFSLKPQNPDASFFEIAEIDLGWIHHENTNFDDMLRQYLIPRKYSKEGPALAVGDVNQDGLEDIYFGGAKGQPGALFLQQTDGQFKAVDNPFFEQLKMAEDVVAEFEDFNQDGFLDLFVGSGGNEHTKDEFFNFDRIFLNDRKGNLIFSPNSLPPIAENTSTVAIHDINKDGFPDLFIGASVVTGNYGEIPATNLLINDGNGKFKNATREYFGDNFYPGMIQKAIWEDIDFDGEKELILACEWSPIKIYKKSADNQFNLLENISLENHSGWFFGLKVHDLDGDGRADLIAGNLGQNSKLKASPEKPVWLYHGDFDNNGQEEALIFHYMGGALVPFASRDDLTKQIPSLKRKHPSYTEYARIKSPGELLDKDQIQKAKLKKVTDFGSGVFWAQDGGGYSFEAFPIEAQFSPIMDFLILPSATNQKYVLGVGNFEGFRNDLGKNAAKSLVLFEIENQEVKIISTGLKKSETEGFFRKAAFITIKGKSHIVLVRNNAAPNFLALQL